MRTLIRTQEDLVDLRIAARRHMSALGFGLAAQTKLVAALSAIARNALQHGGGGVADLETLEVGEDVGLRVVVTDRGPGIADIRAAMRDGVTSTRAGSGFGMSGAARLLDAFQVETPDEGGTRVTLTLWRRPEDPPNVGAVEAEEDDPS